MIAVEMHAAATMDGGYIENLKSVTRGGEEKRIRLSVKERIDL